jgi:D-sedoheptulose 7-phosphate isomerase
MRAARAKSMLVVAFTGKTGGAMPPLSDLTLHVHTDATPLIQQMHITAAHIVCGLVEARLFPQQQPSSVAPDVVAAGG